MVLSEPVQAVVEAMHTSKAQRNQALSKMLRVWVDTNISPFAPSSLAGESRDGETVLILSLWESEAKQYPILSRETARVMSSVPLAMRSRSSAV
jgi:hypothetical protein